MLLSLAALLVLLSVDKIVLFLERPAWLVVLLAVGIAQLGRLGSPAGAPTAKALLGAALFLGGAAGVAASRFIADPAALTIAMGLGRGCELLGVTLLLWRAADELLRHRADPASALGLAVPR